MTRVYVHGLGQTPASWEKTIALSSGKEQAVCPALEELVRDQDADYETLYRAFAQKCLLLDGEIDLCGLSLGGVLALNYAIDHPQKVRSLVLIGVQYRMPKALLKFQNAVFRLMPESMFGEMGFSKKAFLRLCASMMPLDFSAEVDKISCPTLIVCGEKDGANRKASVSLAKAIRQAEFRLVKGAGHEVNQAAPKELANVLRTFYAQVRDGAPSI